MSMVICILLVFSNLVTVSGHKAKSFLDFLKNYTHQGLVGSVESIAYLRSVVRENQNRCSPFSSHPYPLYPFQGFPESQIILPVFLFCCCCCFVFCFFFFVFSRAAPLACGGSQARGLIRAIVASLHQSHSNTESELHLRPTYTTAHGNAGSLTH